MIKQSSVASPSRKEARLRFRTTQGPLRTSAWTPPYYDNVMYAELADYFYVWEKRTLGRLVPEYFQDALSDKNNEAVANPARFAAMGRRKSELADLDYLSLIHI